MHFLRFGYMSVFLSQRIVVFGATGKVGRLLVERLSALGARTLSVGRRIEVLNRLPGESLVLDLSRIAPDTSPLLPGDVVINAAHARHTEAIVKLCPPNIQRLIVMGSTRYLTRFNDLAADEVRKAITLLGETDLPWVMLHPTMIYGAQGENNVQRIASLIRRFHVIPLPGGGRSLIQPIHVEDVVEAIVSAICANGVSKRTIHIAGQEPVTYADFIREIARAIDCRVWVVPVPSSLMTMAARMTRYVPGVPEITKAEVLRLLEDKAVDDREMQKALGVFPRVLADGLAEAFDNLSHGKK